MKNRPFISIFIIIGILIISLATFTESFTKLYSLFERPQKSQTPPSAVARLPFDLQVNNAKKRISYLSKEYLKTETLNLGEVIGTFGDSVLDSPGLYDWNKIITELEKQGYIKVLEKKGNNITFKVLGK